MPCSFAQADDDELGRWPWMPMADGRAGGNKPQQRRRLRDDSDREASGENLQLRRELTPARLVAETRSNMTRRIDRNNVTTCGNTRLSWSTCR
jgi:hypothetical protein